MTVVGPLTVQVTMNVAMPDFPEWLYANGRIGIMAPAQLNSGATARRR